MDKIQLDRNYGLLGGWLVSIVYESMPGYWELRQSKWFSDAFQV